MDPFQFDSKETIHLFRELLTCGSTIFSWTYDAAGELLDTNCDHPVLDKIFSETGCKEYAVNYARTMTAPLLLSAPLGIMWCAAIQRIEEVLLRIHVIGPVFNTEIPPIGIQKAAEQYNVPLPWRSSFIRLLQSLPVVSSTLFFQYGIMLHYCATGEKLSRSDIQFQQARGNPKENIAAPLIKNRRKVYQAEQAILQNVRDGNPDYADVLEQANLISNGVQISTENPVNQVKISLTTFTSLCSRAAIEGGLSPEIAYSVGDSYIQDLIHCGTISELRILSHNMYADFIERVRKCKVDSNLSIQIRSCCDYIDMHLDESLDLKSLADRVGYTEYYLSRKFKKEIGISVSDYIRRARIERAKIMLTTTDLPVAEIAERLRFSSSSHFSDSFRRLIGMLPQAYRRSHLRM